MKKKSLLLTLIFIFQLNYCNVSSQQFTNIQKESLIFDTLKSQTESKNIVHPVKDTITEENDEEGKNIFLSLTGDFQNATSIENSQNNSVTNGSVGMKIIYNKRDDNKKSIFYNRLNKLWEVSLSITLASSNDTVKDNYGSSLLIFKKGVTSGYFQATLYEPLKNFKLFQKIAIVRYLADVLLNYNDIGFYISYSNAVWKKDSTFLCKATNVALGIYTSYDFARYFTPKDNENKDVKCSIGAGLTYRSIVGDLSFEQNDSLRKIILGSDQRKFFGTELKATIGYKNFVINASYIYIFGDRIVGLSRGQFLTSFIFTADVRL